MLTRGLADLDGFHPDAIEITSLFTYAWKPVHDAISFYHERYPDATIRVGGIYATLMAEQVRARFPFVSIHQGLYDSAESNLPAYDLLLGIDRWKGWDTSIVFTSRGCIRKCPFCVVPRIEGRLRATVDDVQRFLYPDYRRVTIWDNNFFASPNWRSILQDLRDTGLVVDFNQGLDARLMDEEKAALLADFKPSIIRMAFDTPGQRKAITAAVQSLANAGIRKRNISFYILYNFFNPKNRKGDSPTDFLERIRYVAGLGCISYPMRYEPPTSLQKNCFVSPLWSEGQLELVAKARRVLGFGGAFPPYEGLVRKFGAAKSFEDAFGLRPVMTTGTS